MMIQIENNLEIRNLKISLFKSPLYLIMNINKSTNQKVVTNYVELSPQISQIMLTNHFEHKGIIILSLFSFSICIENSSELF